jgi:hypothetical protein
MLLFNAAIAMTELAVLVKTLGAPVAERAISHPLQAEFRYYDEVKTPLLP